MTARNGKKLFCSLCLLNFSSLFENDTSPRFLIIPSIKCCLCPIRAICSCHPLNTSYFQQEAVNRGVTILFSGGLETFHLIINQVRLLQSSEKSRDVKSLLKFFIGINSCWVLKQIKHIPVISNSLLPAGDLEPKTQVRGRVQMGASFVWKLNSESLLVFNRRPSLTYILFEQLACLWEDAAYRRRCAERGSVAQPAQRLLSSVKTLRRAAW